MNYNFGMSYEVTIGIPVYNVEKYVRQTLESALSQTFQSVEFLVLDDCGTDSSMDIVRDIQKEHPRGKDIRIITQPQNMGLGNGRNRIIKESKGRYVFFLDSDDLLSSNAIQLMYEEAQKYDAEMIFGSMEKILVYDNSQRIPCTNYSYRVFLKEDEFANWVYRKYDGIQASSCNILIKRDIYCRNNIKYFPINYWEDFTMMMDLPSYVTRVIMLSDITYHYMCRTGSLSNYQRRERIEKDEIVQTMKAVNILKDNSLCIKDKPYFSKRMYKLMKTCFYVCCTILRNKEIIEPSFDKKELRDFMCYPVALSSVRFFRHIPLYILGKLPPSISVQIILFMGKMKHLV